MQRQRDKVIQDAKDEMERQGHLKYSNIEVEHRDNKIELRKLDKANQTLTVQNVKQREEIARLEVRIRAVLCDGRRAQVPAWPPTAALAAPTQAQLETLPGTERQLRETHYDRDKLEADLVRTTSNLKARVEECATKDAEIERLELVPRGAHRRNGAHLRTKPYRFAVRVVKAVKTGFLNPCVRDRSPSPISQAGAGDQARDDRGAEGRGTGRAGRARARGAALRDQALGAPGVHLVLL